MAALDDSTAYGNRLLPARCTVSSLFILSPGLQHSTRSRNSSGLGEALRLGEEIELSRVSAASASTCRMIGQTRQEDVNTRRTSQALVPEQ